MSYDDEDLLGEEKEPIDLENEDLIEPLDEPLEDLDFDDDPDNRYH